MPMMTSEVYIICSDFESFKGLIRSIWFRRLQTILQSTMITQRHLVFETFRIFRTSLQANVRESSLTI